ncbi:MAG: Clp protease ClpP [Bacteroidetes bacterium]|nr:Clp protease ClpP [Bacteroidota bacterium]
MKQGITIIENKAGKEATIDIDGYIGENWWKDSKDQNTKERLRKELKDIANISAEVIHVNINSLGGDVNHGLSIHDLLAEHPAKVITKINGMTASAATIIALAGDERRMSDNALGLIHLSSMGMWGNTNDFKVAISDMEKINERIANMYAKVGNKDAKYFEDLMNENNGRGKWIDAAEMLDIGLITEKFEPKKMAASYDFEGLGLPEPPEDLLKKNNINNEVPEVGLWGRIREFFAPGVDNEGNILNNNQKEENMNLDELNGKIEAMQALIDNQATEINDLKTKIAPAAADSGTEGIGVTNSDDQATIAELNASIEALQAEIVNLKGAPAEGVTGGQNPPANPGVKDEWEKIEDQLKAEMKYPGGK